MSNKDNNTNNKSNDSQVKQESRKNNWFVENVLSLGMALLIVLVIRSSIVEAFKIPSGSMIPTLLIGDHIFVNKFSYGLIVPFTDWILDEPIYIFRRENPKSGDVIVFRFPKNPSQYYIKRVIGTPGDTVEIKNKQIFINGNPVNQTPVSDEKKESILASLENSRYQLDGLKIVREDLSSSRPTIMLDQYNYSLIEFEPITVPENHFFVMGDNRDYSNDSRFWGFVPMKNVKGRAFVIWLNYCLPGLGCPEDQEFSFRPSRIGTILQ